MCFLYLVINGTGEVVGALSLPLGHGAIMLKKVASVKMLHQPHDFQNIMSCPLRRKVSYVYYLMHTRLVQSLIFLCVSGSKYILALFLCFLFLVVNLLLLLLSLSLAGSA